MSRNGEASLPSVSRRSLTSVNHAAHNGFDDDKHATQEAVVSFVPPFASPPSAPSTGKYKQTITRETFGIHSRAAAVRLFLESPPTGAARGRPSFSRDSQILLGYIFASKRAAEPTFDLKLKSLQRRLLSSERSYRWIIILSRARRISDAMSILSGLRENNRERKGRQRVKLKFLLRLGVS